jgi:hypothetical protein
MGKAHSAGKGDRPRPVDKEKWENSPLWDNLKKKKSKEEK